MDRNILEEVLDEFKGIAAIPRPSKHEQAIGRYLEERLKALGLKVERDAIGNVIGDLDASADCEKAPRVIMQSHMDMVCVADEGIAFNPLTDPIKLIRAENYLYADGTSLGADDGIGIAIIICVLKNLIDNPERKHGAIRAIFTVDEEAGMSGANALDVRYLNDAAYLFNCDSENCDELVVGSAGSVHIDFHRRLECGTPTGSNAFRLNLKGFKGGHSGEEIHAGRANAIKILGELLTMIEKNGGKVELSSLKGGKATNAIADYATAEFVTVFDIDHMTPITDFFIDGFKKKFGALEGTAVIKLEKIARPKETMPVDVSADIISLLKGLKQGVISMATADLVETSANIGIVSFDGDQLLIRYFPRSSLNGKLIEIVDECKALGTKLNFEVESSEPSAAWTENRNSRLARLLTDIFKRQNGREMKVKTIHAGLESSYFYVKNPSLDIVSIGTTNEHIHTPRERLKLSTVAVQVNLIEEALLELTK